MTSNDLITIETLKPADVFKPGAVAKLIAEVEEKVRAIPAADHTTEKGRNEIKALAYKVTRSKTALDDMGKNFVAELKKAAGVVDADRRLIRDRLEALKDEVRKPVDEYEAREEIRIDVHKANMESLQALDTFAIGEETVDEVDSRLLALCHLQELDWQEFTDGADRLMGMLSTSLSTLRTKLIRQEEEKAELDRLRKAEAERQAREALRAMEIAQQERDKEISERAVRDTEVRNAAVAKAKEQERLAAISRAENAERAIKAESARTLAAERQRVEQARIAEEAATKKREANTKHLAKINNAALADLMKVAGVTDKIGRSVIVAIASGKVSNITINY